MNDAAEEYYTNLDIDNLPDAREKKSKSEPEKPPSQSDYEDVKIWTILALLLVIILESCAIVVLSLKLVFR